MKKFILDLTIVDNIRLNANYSLLKMTNKEALPDMIPGQFAELRVDNSPSTFLRRPISINYVDRDKNEVWFLIQLIGDGTRSLGNSKTNDIINVILPLGNGFTLPRSQSEPPLQVVGRQEEGRCGEECLRLFIARCVPVT